MNSTTHARMPKFRHHKATGQGYVELNGHRYYLGRYGSADGRQRYDTLINEWLANGRTMHTHGQLTVTELIDRFWQHAKIYYRNADGSSSKELQNFRLALRPLQDLYGNSLAAEFGPRKLKAVRQDLVNGGATKRRNPDMEVQGGSRMYVNKQIRRVKLMFKWAVAEELIPPAIYQSLQAVKGLKRGRCEVRETDPIKPVLQSDVDAIEPYVSAQVWALVQLQLLTGARAGELVLIRAINIDTGGQDLDIST